MTSRRFFWAIPAILLASCFLAGPAPAQPQPQQPPPAAKPAQQQPNAGDDEPAPWVRPVQYTSVAVLVIGVVLLVFLRLRGRKPGGGKDAGSGGTFPQ